MRALQVDGKVRQNSIGKYPFQRSEVQVFLFFIFFESFLMSIRFILCFCPRVRKIEFTQEKEKPASRLLL
jgi:hypothetical protein